MGYYLCQMLSAAEALGAHHHAALRRARLMALASPVLIASAITCTAIALPDAYRTAAPSYLGYIALDLGLAAMWLRARQHHPAALSHAFVALALASMLFAVVDAADLLYYLNIWRFDTGTAFDLVWTIPTLCYIVAVRIGRLDESPKA